jgi:hypothetical protein
MEDVTAEAGRVDLLFSFDPPWIRTSAAATITRQRGSAILKTFRVLK